MSRHVHIYTYKNRQSYPYISTYPHAYIYAYSYVHTYYLYRPTQNSLLELGVDLTENKSIYLLDI